MENNTPVVDTTTPVATETVTPVTTTAPAATVTTATASKLPLILGVTAVVAVAAVAGYFLLVRPGQTTSSTPAGSGVNAENPQAAVDALNPRLAAFLTADNADGVDALTGANNVEAVEFKLTLAASDKTSSQSLGLVFSGKAASKDGQTGAFTGKGELTANVQGLNNVSADIELQLGDLENLYFKLSNFEPAETAAFLPLIGLDLDTWYKFPIDASAATNPSSTAEQLTNVDVERLQNNPLLINPRAAADRTVFGKTLKCLIADINPALMEGNSAMPFPVEYCGGDTALPMAIGFNMEDASSTASLIVEIVDIPSFTVTAPEGAKDATTILEGLGLPGAGAAGGAAGTMPDEQTRLMNPDDFDYSDFTPEELMAL